MRLRVLLTVLSASFVPKAAAQTGDHWLIVATTTSDDSWLEPTESSVREELTDHGVGVWSRDNAVTRFEANGSAPASQVTEAAIREWFARSKAILESLVQGAPAKALDQLNEAGALSLSTIEELNREPERSQKVLDTCLYGVRALLETRSPSSAETQARECRKVVLHGEPSAHMHPPQVLEMLDRVDAARTRQTGALRVESKPSGCAVRVNGLMLGETPIEVRNLFPGRYAVQVECDLDRRGRVHSADVKAAPTDVFVDSRFDDAIMTRPVLLLHYASSLEEEQHRNADAVEIAKIVPTDIIMLLSAPDPTVVELELLGGTPPKREALARIRSARKHDLTTLPPVMLPCGDEPGAVSANTRPEDGWPAARTPRGQFISGLTLLGVGSASLLSGYVLIGPRARTAEDWVNALDAGGQESASLQQKWLNMGNGMIVTSSVGAAALVAAMPLALPKRAKTPWWAWLSGGLGVGFAAFSVAYGVTAEAKPNVSCTSLVNDATDARTCVKRGEQISVAVLTGMTAAPLLTIPLVYLFRPSDAHITPSVEVSRSGGYVGIRGEF
ncbi:MAG: PEGA domain-containing protein [Deltaproteobacteria bacterium]|nr:PEGA domain-containing protein [Deltaproteobacteria bacterium]